MPIRRRSLSFGPIVTVCCCAVGFCGALAADEPPTKQAAELSLWDQTVALYESAKAAGEKVPSDIYEWARQDVHNIGDWEYRVVAFSKAESEILQTKLNELGEDRWECFWVSPERAKTTFYFKRPSRSYLKTLPLGDLLKLIPTGGGSD